VWDGGSQPRRHWCIAAYHSGAELLNEAVCDVGIVSMLRSTTLTCSYFYRAANRRRVCARCQSCALVTFPCSAVDPHYTFWLLCRPTTLPGCEPDHTSYQLLCAHLHVTDIHTTCRLLRCETAFESGTIIQTRASRGFTLVELIVTIAVVGILLSVAMPAMQGFLQNDRQAEANSVSPGGR
jgi:prepilin-type N-terminal cleavage/methylation domain-containing protein